MRSRWEQIADVLRVRIEDGTYPPRTMVSESRLQQEFGAARSTVRKAIRQLAREGLMVGKPGLGSFVVDRASDPGGVRQRPGVLAALLRHRCGRRCDFGRRLSPGANHHMSGVVGEGQSANRLYRRPKPR
ncbi:GntR family transcriptional regulator [Nocardiopsis rhodophaea]|uniref:GntR family transcriptional regulator n=1 Tax=Nocardiopsis rhodophaea TaxID=280238 RepID=UPI0031E46961